MAKTFEQVQGALAPLLKATLGDNMLGAFTHGDVWSVSLYLRTSAPKALPDFAPVFKALRKVDARLGYLFTPETISTATDTFPLEFLELSRSHKLLLGEFPLQGFEPNMPMLRLQCERELRGLHIHLQREYVHHASEPKALRAMFTLTLPRFLPIFRAIGVLTQGRYLLSDEECLQAVDTEWQLGNLFSRLGAPPKGVQDLRSLAGDYILGIERILTTIDRMEVKQ